MYSPHDVNVRAAKRAMKIFFFFILIHAKYGAKIELPAETRNDMKLKISKKESVPGYFHVEGRFKVDA